MEYNIFELIIILRIIILLINFFVLNWLIKLDKCKCSNINEGLYLKEWFVFIIILNIIKLFYIFIYGITNNNDNNNEILLFNIIIVIINIIMIIRLLIYINKLKEIKCDCGLSKLENFIYYWYIIVFSLFMILLALALLYYFFIDKY